MSLAVSREPPVRRVGEHFVSIKFPFLSLESNLRILCIVNVLPIFCDKYIQHSPLWYKTERYSTVQYRSVIHHLWLNGMFTLVYYPNTVVSPV